MSITWQVEQGSEEWLRKRLGIPTASQFHRVITPKGALSEKRYDYRNELLAERILGRRMERFQPTAWMRRGTELEGEAVEHFQQHQRDVYGRPIEVETVGFVTTDDRRLGCSPDRLIKRSGGNAPREAVEIKCPAPWTHVGYLLDELGDDYAAQVQGQMYVAELDVVHFYSYCPGLPPYYATHQRRTGFIDRLHTCLSTFLDELEAGEKELRQQLATGPGGLDAEEVA